MKDIKVMFSKNTDDWKTPSDLYKCFMDNGWIDTFPFQSTYDELNNDYFNSKLFINPPFSKLDKISDWIIKQLGNNVIALLIPARTDTVYFHKLLRYRPIVIFIKGRLHYNDSKSAPFPTLLLIFKNNPSVQYHFLDQDGLKQLIGVI